MFNPTGVNQNFQYCGHNFASLPNGVGFGGQVMVLTCITEGEVMPCPISSACFCAHFMRTFDTCIAKLIMLHSGASFKEA